ncbi:MAG TPA: histidine kinase [Rhodanobacteraceae bacterium]|nr:histidine kinase [Rhodanobacteraceae bacterium]
MAEIEARRWLPQFCRLPTLFAVMVVAELVALVVVLTPGPQVRSWLPRLGVISVFVQWLALLEVVVLCSLRQTLDRLPARTGFGIAWLLAVLVTALGSAVIHSMDRALGLGLTVAAGHGTQFVLANAAICALIAAALLRYLYVQDRWRERVRATAKAQVDALQARIRPHFLFNSMNTIASLIGTRPQEAERTVLDLADLFRAALGADDNGPGTLGEELDLIDNYLRIEKQRLGDRLRIDLRVDALPRELPLPRLLLQPLVENAVYHGIQQLPGGGTIRIVGSRVRDGVEISVDNPVPADAATVGNGLALANIRDRIGYHFGDRAQLRIESGADAYTVTVHLPDQGM